METLQASGRLQLDRIVVDAAAFDSQMDLITAFRTAGVELILDTNTAELASIGRYDGQCRHLPWARQDRPWNPDDFDHTRIRVLAGNIARFAINRGLDAVLAPTHILRNARDPWAKIDWACCEALRIALDSEGGRHVAIDFPILLPLSVIRDEAERNALIAALAGLPFENLWLRVSGFGHNGTATGTRRYINAARDFHRLGKSVIADCVGGMPGIALPAFGAVSGIAHGISEKERFDTYDWSVRRSKSGGGSAARIYLERIDLQLAREDVAALFEIRGARSLLACTDTTCCAHGIDDMLKNYRTHFLIQRSRQIANLSRVPEARRTVHFLDHHLAPAERIARKASRLNFPSDYLAERIRARQDRLDDLRQVLESLHETSRDAGFCQPVASRNRSRTSHSTSKG